MRHHAALLLVVALTTALSAQDYRVEVRLVEIEVRVTDRGGVPITDLSRAGIRFKDLDTTQSSLEDIFVDLVRRDR